ncbi:MAG: tRNA glutamyl-Q(34) synthetase GluQRS [Gammaproteobacteria bacterium]
MNGASVSTATATTATGSRPPGAPAYVGRFAPSPTGSLHLGSLVAALGSYLDARHHGGRWLLRMEDLDTPRVVPGCADTILRTLESFGLTWDGEVVWQSRRTELYRAAAERLRSKGLTFECSCPRRLRLENEDRGYPGTCRDKPVLIGTEPGSTATRFRIDDATLTVEDRFQGRCELPLRSMGDVVIRRRDGIFAYQLAVVVDDADQEITDVVRGADLLSSTAWQVCMQHALNVISPAYAHLPLIVEPDGTKLSKTRRSIALDTARISPLLLGALQLLGQRSTTGLELEAPESILRWAVEHWDPEPLRGVRTRPALQS